MLSKLSNRTLIILMALLGAIVGWTYFSETKKNESNFREEFVKVDTAAVTEIYIYPKAAPGEEIKFFRSGKNWRVTNGKEESPVDVQTVSSLFSSFANLKTKSLAATSNEQWENFMVGDTSANRIKFITPSATTDIMVGKFAFNNESRSASTYVRMNHEKEVYLVDGFLSFTINQPFDAWRNRALIRKGEQQWTKITFSYPGDSSFAILRDSTTWLIRGDTAFNGENFVNEIAFLNGTHIAGKTSLPAAPLYRISVDGMNMTPVTIDFFPASNDKKYYVKSSFNPETVFSDNDGVLAAKLLRPMSYFISKHESKKTDGN
ncbi:MAG: DUF4340 domain-containing protein [Bacteroidia bacterium]|nr:DUF4340 domain-containing protein [Bacteroidia bacterium]